MDPLESKTKPHWVSVALHVGQALVQPQAGAATAAAGQYFGGPSVPRLRVARGTAPQINHIGIKMQLAKQVREGANAQSQKDAAALQADSVKTREKPKPMRRQLIQK